MLTKRQKQILDFIEKYIEKNEYPPSIEKIKKHFKLKSVSTIHEHIEGLKSKGYLENKARTIQLAKQKIKNKTKLIIICGLQGSGKTTLAKKLSKKLKIVCICKDDIKEKLYESMKFSTLKDSKRIGKPSIDIMLHLAEQQLINGVNVIIESPFNFLEDYDLFRNWKKKYKLNIYSIICSADFNERKKRFLTRKRHAAHHDAQRILDHIPEKKIEYNYETMPEKQIRITTNKKVEVLIQNIIKKISN